MVEAKPEAPAVVKKEAPPANAQQLRQLKIKTGVLKRSVKDHISYSKEKTKQEEQLENTKAQEGAEPSDIKLRENMLAETVQMLPMCITNIQKAIDDLSGVQALVEESVGEDEEALAALKEGAEWQAAD